MRIISTMPKTEIFVEDGCVVLSQYISYNTSRLTFPLEFWPNIAAAIAREIASGEIEAPVES